MKLYYINNEIVLVSHDLLVEKIIFFIYYENLETKLHQNENFKIFKKVRCASVWFGIKIRYHFLQASLLIVLKYHLCNILIFMIIFFVKHVREKKYAKRTI